MNAATESRWKPMDVAFGDTLRRPRRLILEVHGEGRYETCTESDGIGGHSDCSLRSLQEFLVWVDRFSDDITGRELREVKEAARAPFVEPESWAAFRKRYAETGAPWLKEGVRS